MASSRPWVVSDHAWIWVTGQRRLRAGDEAVPTLRRPAPVSPVRLSAAGLEELYAGVSARDRTSCLFATSEGRLNEPS